MNKKAQTFDFNNPSDWPGIILWVFVVIIVISILGTALYQFNKSLNCGDEIAQRDSCCSNAKQWEAYALSLNNTINNCTNLIQEQIDTCDAKINETNYNLTIEVNSYQELVSSYKITFVIYNILFIFFYIPISLNLFNITFDLGLGEEWERLRKWYTKAFLIVKIFFWIVLTLLFAFYVFAFLTATPTIL